MPDASVAASTDPVAGPSVQGSVYGGHAPLQGAHIYLLQPGITGYGSVATSLLGNNGATSAGGVALVSDVSDPKVTVGAKYVTTDAKGIFNLTGSYSCVVGQPVYIYAYGGNIGSTPTSTPTTATLNIAAAATSGNQGSARNPSYTYTFTAPNATANPLTAGATITLALARASNWANLNGTQTVVTANATSFTITGNVAVTGSDTGTATYTYTAIGTQAPTTNTSIVQLATVGLCPSAGNLYTPGSSPSFIYLNEVSTVATAYTFQPFTTTAFNDAFHVGSSGTPQALLGIANAANTAAQLYNIQGGSQTSTSGDGEGHLANYITPTGNGNGIIPQATLDSLANILANCVDAVPTAVGNVPPQCSSLFSVATQDGTTTGTKPVDTATAAMYIARYPAGNSSSTAVDPTFVSDIFSLQTGTVPYVPDLVNPPNDWTIAINYPMVGKNIAPAYTGVTNPFAQEAESLSIDASGEVWVTGQGSNSIVRLSSLGVIDPSTAQQYLTYIPGYVSVDGSNNAWTGSANSSTPIFEAGSNGTFTATYGTPTEFNSAYVNIADSTGNDYFFASDAGTYGMYEYPAKSATNATPNVYSLNSTGFGTNNHVAHGAIDSGHNFWLTSETNSGGATSNYQIAKVTDTGTTVWLHNTQVEQPEFIAIDNNGTGWIPNQGAAGPVYKITSTSSSLLTLTSSSTGATFSYPFGSAVDGNGNVWITNRCGPYNSCTYPSTASSTLVELNGTGTTTTGTVNTAISPTTNFLPQTQYPSTATTFTRIMQDPLNIAVDPSGNIWITNYAGNSTNGSITEIVGTAAPVVTPLSVAAATNKLGAKP
jgi:hypothetical protein